MLIRVFIPLNQFCDWLTDGKINAICRFGRDFGLPVPTVFGKGYRLPAIPGGLAEKHFGFHAAFLKLTSRGNDETR